MPDEMRVKYLFVNLRYSTYVKLEMALVAVLLIAALSCFLFARDSRFLLLRNGWWLCLLGAVLEAGESFLAIRHAKTRSNDHAGAGNSS